MQTALVHRGAANRRIVVRALNWELTALADAFEQLADHRRSEWTSKLLGAELCLSVTRHSKRGDAYTVTTICSDIGGPLPADLALAWDGERATAAGGSVQGLQMVCGATAMRLFASDLRSALTQFPVRRLPKNRLHLGQPT